MSRAYAKKARGASIIIIAFLCGCSARVAVKGFEVDEAVFAPGNYICLRAGGDFIICSISSGGDVVPMDTITLRPPSGAVLIAADCVNRRLFFFGGDSVFAYDDVTGLFRTLTSGAFARDVACARLSSDGRFLAFTASPWSLGRLSFWRLVVVDAFEGGIVHFCDSLPSPGAFRWLRPRRIGYAVCRVLPSGVDTVGAFFELDRRVVIPSRNGELEFLSVPCDPHVSPDGAWAAVVEGGRLRLLRRTK